MSTDVVRDSGLQPERTRLAWRRTTLSCTMAAALAGRTALAGDVTPVGMLATGLCGVAWLSFLALAHHRIHALRTPRPGPLRCRTAVAAAAGTVALAAFGTVIIL